jgi:polysaccharide export outer membrane protein
MERVMKKLIRQQVVWIFRWVGLLIVGGLLVGGCASTNGDRVEYSPLPGDLTNSPSGPATNGAVSSAATNATPAGDGRALATLLQNADRFAVGDLITVKFSGTIDNIPPHEERTKDDGNITLPLIGAVQAAGKTPTELQKEIHDRYVPDYYKRLTVIVTGEQRVYYVGGQVRQPGRQVYLGTTTVTKAIQSAGDFTDFAAKRRVELTRADEKTITLDCVKAAKDPSLDLPVYPGDKINVPLRGWRDVLD